MLHVPIVLGSVRRERQSPKVARFVHACFEKDGRAKSEILDLLEYDLPIMEERLRMRDDPPPGLEGFSEKVKGADALVLVCPEYHHGYPGVLKNALDYLGPEFARKPVGIASVSGGAFGGVRAQEQLRLVCLGFGALPLPAGLVVPHVHESFDEEGRPAEPAWEKRGDHFVDQVIWYADALAAKKRRDAEG